MNPFGEPWGEGGALLQTGDGTGNVSRRAKWKLALRMATARKLAAMLVVAAAATGCSSGGNNNVASHSPSPVPSTSPQPTSTPRPQPVTGAYGVLYSSQAASTYAVSIVAIDGKVVASQEVSTPPSPSCANTAAALVSPPVSTSDSRAYFMDAQGVVHYLGVSGETGRATTLPASSGSRRSMFAVSPDDQRIAVVVDDFTSSGATTHLYVEDLNGGANHLDLFSETGAYTLWPTGWHGTNNLVLGKIPSCAQGGSLFCCGPYAPELHVVDPASGTRRFTLGGSCVVTGAPSLAGAVCVDPSNVARVLNWTAVTVRSFQLSRAEIAFLSPSGAHVAMIDNGATLIQDTGKSLSGLFVCAWIDDTHVISGGDLQHQPRVADVTTGAELSVPAQGDCAGRLPGEL